MGRMRRAVALLLFLLLLLSCGPTLAEGEQSVDAIDQTARSVSAYADDALYRQIQDTYRAAKKRSRRRSFKGYCGAYVANQLVVLGINTSYLSANGKNTYDIYRNMTVTTGGYGVAAYGAKQYTLLEALSAIQGEDPAACNILVGFQRGTSSAGKKYGHVLFIHGIRNGMIYFSDSCARTIDDVTYKEGEPIVCSLAAFSEQYARYKLDGVVHFQKADGAQKSVETQPSMISDTACATSEKVLALG